VVISPWELVLFPLGKKIVRWKRVYSIKVGPSGPP